jgi:hypothetical protein
MVVWTPPTQGTWTGIYGAGGEHRRARLAGGSSSRIASTYYSTGSFTINVNLTDGNTHRIALHLLDWDSTARTESVSILSAINGAVLDTETYSSFHNGE